eukprot:11731005-Alexandrium_andersonii.AAC.1
MSPGGPDGPHRRVRRAMIRGTTAGAPTTELAAGRGPTSRRMAGTSPSGAFLPTGQRSGATARS